MKASTNIIVKKMNFMQVNASRAVNMPKLKTVHA